MAREVTRRDVRRQSRVSRAILVLALALAGVAWLGLAGKGLARGAGGPMVSVREHPELGPILVGPDGGTLYAFDKDPAGVSTCTGDCARNWPPLLSDGALPPALPGLAGELGLIRRPAPDHRVQVTYRGRPLHYWARDRTPGEARGHGAGSHWFVARP